MSKTPPHTAFAALLLCGIAAAGCDGSDRAEAPAAAPTDRAQQAKHTVEIVSARKLGTLEVRDPETGELASIECATCHGLARESKPASIHAALGVAHGDLTCDMCHTRGDRSALHLADGREVPFERAMDLCAQCHGPQTRDYNKGSHGGMSGYWDLTRGPRVRNDCTNCHDPHRPAYPVVDPAPGPRDRFLEAKPTREGAH